MDSTLRKGLEILERVIEADEPVSVSALARELGLHKSNVHRTLTSLRACGYLVYDSASRRYYPSLKIAHLGTHVARNFPFKKAVTPVLKELVLATGESAHFVCQEGSNVAFLVNLQPAVGVASSLPDNLMVPWYDTAFGVALVAAMPEEGAQRFLAEIDDNPRVFNQVKAARKKGYALLERHDARRIFEIAVPVRPDPASASGAIGITGPAMRFSKVALDAQVEAIKKAANTAFAVAQIKHVQATQKSGMEHD